MRHKNVFALVLVVTLSCWVAKATPNKDLIAAVERLDAAGVTEALLAKANPNLTIEGRPLIRCIFEKLLESDARTQVVRALLEGGANASYGDDGSAGMLTILDQRDWRIAALLLNQVPGRWESLVAATMARVEAAADAADPDARNPSMFIASEGNAAPRFAPGAPEWPTLS